MSINRLEEIWVRGNKLESKRYNEHTGYYGDFKGYGEICA